ncbi:MAG TPA: MFS transporter [Gaiellaceae bacterium]|nr:MFS transporter [Gaiellaceae bacterium]
MTLLFSPFRSRNFRLLWLASTVSLLGDGFYYVAVGWQTLALSDSATALSLVWLAFTLPHMASLLFGGVLSDRLSRRQVLLGANLVSGGALGAVGILSLAGTLRLWHLFVLVAVYGAAEAVFGPAFVAIVPELVDQDLLAQANSLNQLNRPLALRLVGPAVGGVIVASLGAGAALALDAGTFGVSALCISAMRLPVAASAAAGRGVRGVLGEIGAGFGAVRRVPWLWAGMGAYAVATFVTWGCVQALLPLVVKDDLGGGARMLGAVFAAGGVGAVIAAVTIGRRGLTRRPLAVFFCALAGNVAAVSLFGLASGPALALLAGLLMSGLATAAVVIWRTLIHERVEGTLLGRVNSIDWLVSTSLVPVALVVVGPLADAVGAQRLLVGAGVAGTLGTLAFLLVPGVLAAERAADAPADPYREPTPARGIDTAAAPAAAPRAG